jgi:hypothetical protein
MAFAWRDCGKSKFVIQDKLYRGKDANRGLPIAILEHCRYINLFRI